MDRIYDVLASDTLRKALYRRLSRPIEAFAGLGETVDTATGPLTYIDNDADVLAVAHLDYVLWDEPRLRNGTVYCPQLDDRLGAWVILDVLPVLGVNVDVLLTDSEEIGQSSAQWFEPEKAYNWMFQFDRAGTDVVMYQYHTADLSQKLESCNWDVGRGAFSDISSMSHLGCAGFNFGVGYHSQHSPACHADLRDTAHNLTRFVKFFHKYSDEMFPYGLEDDRDVWDTSIVDGWALPDDIPDLDREWLEKIMREETGDDWHLIGNL